MFNCEFTDRCINAEKCMRCTDHSLLQMPEDKKRKQLQRKAVSSSGKKDTLDDCSESWKDLEQAVADRISALPTTKQYNDMREARRQARSGAIWFMPGDVTDTVILAECKERSATTAKGEKSITIPKSWLEKLDEEAKLDGKYPTFAFRYKNDDAIYSINHFETLEEMVLEIKYLRVENQRMTQQELSYKKVLKEQESEIRRLLKLLEDK